MRKFSILFYCIGFSICLEIYEPGTNDEWQRWKSTHLKSYNTINEERVRLAIWSDNLRRIAEYNRQNAQPHLKINQFGDLTNREFQQIFLEDVSKMNVSQPIRKESRETIPDTVDWRETGCVTPVKNQGECGQCWHLVSIDVLEAQEFIKKGKLVALSRQNLIDCCDSRSVDGDYNCIQQHGGIDTEASYPFRSCSKGQCHFNPATVGATVNGVVNLPMGDEKALKVASATIGPIGTAIDASHLSFQFYHSGVYDESKCSSTQLDHVVQIIGYGSQDGADYWLVKNSWGESWGMNGYIMMRRNKNNQCGIATQASYPIAG